MNKMEGSTSNCNDEQVTVLEHEHPLELLDLLQKRQHSEETDDDDDDDDDDDGEDLDTMPEFRGSTSKCKDGQIMVLEHRHPLELVDLQRKLQHSEESDDDEDDMVPEFRGQCGRCSQVISEYHKYYYKCVDTSCDYSLHKFCADLPPELEHTTHVHPLVICQFNELGWSYCDVCKSDHKPEDIAYTCPTTNCYFSVDVNCVLGVEETKFYHPSHPHQLVSTFSKPILCLCDACGTKHEGLFYRCTICSFDIHRDCAFLPRNLLIQETTDDRFYHTHPLVLSYSFSRTDQGARYYPKCRVCGLGFGYNDRIWVYKCEKCWYYAHLNCATSRIEPFMSILSSSGLGKKNKNYIDAQHPDLLHLPFPDQNHSLQKHMFSRKFWSESSTRTHEGDPKHTIHQHPLILVDAQFKDMTMSTASDIKPLPCHDPLKKIELLCNACVRPIMDVPYYMCTNEDQHCNFAIHEWCTRLPTKLHNHPIHQQHELVLLTNVSREFFSVFTCAICELDCNGFAYYCVQCNDYLDVTCGLIPKEITHDSHPNHLLILKKHVEGRCKVCSNGTNYTHSFSCESCDDFKMHIECALLLPKTVRHRYDKKHAFNLSYFPVDNHPAEYFCDICESSLDPTHGFFYHCNDCDQSMHLACAPMMFHWETLFRYSFWKGNVNTYINIKFRGSHSIKDHPHPLSFVQGLASDGNCERCKRELQYDLIFKCSQCKFAIDYDCCKGLSNYRDEDEGSDDEE